MIRGATSRLALLGCLAGAWACRGRAATDQAVAASVGGVEDGPLTRGMVASEPVSGLAAARSRSFAVELRTPVLKQFPCTSCHDGPVVSSPRTGDVHQNVEPVHPAETGAACTGCHASRRVDLLVLARGETATLDQAYRLCAQCHFAEVADWAGGGHGKRLAAWAGPRVVKNCTGCHDPHRPAFGKRRPLPGPRLPPNGGER